MKYLIMLSLMAATAISVRSQDSTTHGGRNLLIGTPKSRPVMRIIKWNGKKYPGTPVAQAEYRALPDVHVNLVFNFKGYEEQWYAF